MTIHATSSDLVTSARFNTAKSSKLEQTLKHATISSSGGFVPPHLLVTTKPVEESEIRPCFEEETIITPQGTYVSTIDYTVTYREEMDYSQYYDMPYQPYAAPYEFDLCHSAYQAYPLEYECHSYPPHQEYMCHDYPQSPYTDAEDHHPEYAHEYYHAPNCPQYPLYSEQPAEAQPEQAPVVVSTPRSESQRSDPRTPLIVHNPYSFDVYEEVYEKIVEEDGHVIATASSSAASVCSASLPDTEHEQDLEDSFRKGEEAQPEAQEDAPKPRRQVIAPCGHHEQARRLRFKKGVSHYLCTECSQKWRQ
jgi:hypothetical protein